jgi:WD40 repeat protein
LVSSGDDHTITVWDISSGERVGALTGHSAWVSSLAFNPTGDALASGDRDGAIMLWNLATGQPLGGHLTGHTDDVTSLAFSPDGKTLASGGGDWTVIFWDVANHTALGQPLTGHTGLVCALAFSPDGRTLASGARDDERSIILWDVASQQPIGQPLAENVGGVRSLAFSPDGQTLASGGWEGVDVLLWEVGLEAWIDRACQVANRNLSLDEWNHYVGSDTPYRCTCPGLPPGEGAPAEECQG